MGWPQRKAHLHRVVGMSRFLIRPSVRCHNLASHVLGMSLRGLGDDFEARYGYRPWLVESFVDTEQYAGTCYQASNWLRVGQTQGRGRQDRGHERAKTIKAIYLYVLEPALRARLGVSEPAGLGALTIDEGLEGEVWAAAPRRRACALWPQRRCCASILTPSAIRHPLDAVHLDIGTERLVSGPAPPDSRPELSPEAVK